MGPKPRDEKEAGTMMDHLEAMLKDELVYCVGYTTKDGLRVACPERRSTILGRVVPEGELRCGSCAEKHFGRIEVLRLMLFRET